MWLAMLHQAQPEEHRSPGQRLSGIMNTKAKLTDTQHRYHEERRQLLMDAAADVIAKQGIHSTTMDDISASLGMTKIVLYRTFATKDKLIESILERVTDELLGVDALDIMRAQ
jgi:AcrR family transcriptional regulator